MKLKKECILIPNDRLLPVFNQFTNNTNKQKETWLKPLGGITIKTHLFSGHAELPASIQFQNKYVSVIFEIDIESGTIVGCAFPFHGEVMNRFLIGVFQGKSIETDIESICKELNERMHTHSKKAVIKAVMKIVKHYWLVKRRLQSC